MKRAVYLCALSSTLSLLSACDLPRSSQPSVLVVAVEGLGFDKLSCDTESSPAAGPEASAFEILCQESVRFSHAYSPSTMSQATLASVMTGLYPFDHGVHHNGSDFLSAHSRTLAEGALSKGYRTLFVSGGAPIWRKSGLAQGFEIFDDNVDVALGTYYRPAADVFRIATSWLESEVGGKPFLTFAYLADLQFPQVATHSKDGETREKSAAGQLEEINESMGEIFRWLRAHRRWNSTNIIFLGLNSFERREGDDIPSLNLKSASVQVALLIKPARREGDNIIQWAVDRNVSLVDVGYTLFGLLGLDLPVTSLASVQPQSLVGALNQPEPNWAEDRLVLTETAWPDWMEGAGVRWAIRQNQFLYIHDRKPLIFNTLTDRLENYPLRVTDPLWTSLNSRIHEFLARLRAPAFRGMQSHWLEQIQMGRSLWLNGEESPRAKGSEPWAKWVLAGALARRDWKEVRRLSAESADPIGFYVAAKHLGGNPPLPRNSCVRLLLAAKGDKRALESECEDERLLAFYAWQTAKNEEDRIPAQERFLRIYGQYWLDREIGRINFLNDLRWDVDRGLPELPPMIDYLLSLKEFEPFARRLSVALAGKDLRF
jgi:hypothetical protein